MADDETQNDEGKTTANKTPEDIKAQNDPRGGTPAFEVDHGEPSEASKAEAEAAEEVKNDPWGNTPVQMRDTHDELVDPELNEPGSDVRRTGGGVRLDPMEPQVDDGIAEEHGVSGGTNAPA
jgi:hypothetical protein